MHAPWRACLALVVALAVPSARATGETATESEDTASRLAGLEREIEALRSQHATEIAELKARIAQLESAAPAPSPPPQPSSASAPSAEDAALEAELARALAAAPAPSPAPSPRAAAGGGLRLIDLSLNALAAAGASTRPDDDIAKLEGGGHDPHQRGFTVQNVETSFAGAVDPWLRGDAHVVFQITPEGETSVELEEAYLTTQALPHGLQLKAGQFFVDFGRLNPQHPHQWSFVDQPVALTRLLGGDGLRGPGARISWLLPTKRYSELFLGALNARGETAASFVGPADATKFAGHPLSPSGTSDLGDIAWTARWLNSVDLARTATLNLGVSAALGPNATGDDARTRLLGLDAYYKWTKPTANKGFPFVSAQAELLQRRYRAKAALDGAGVLVPGETLTDWGAYAQVTWGFRPGWTWGMRGDFADGERGDAEDNRLDPLRDRRMRWSTAFTWYPSEFSKLRFQISQDRAEFLGNGHPGEAASAWVQWEFNLGAHGAHQF